MLVIPLLTLGLNGAPATAMLTGFFRPDDPKKVILSFEAQDSLRRLAALIPAGQGVVGRPENGSPLMCALFGTNTLYRSIPIPTTGDEIVIGTGFDDMAARPDVCEAMARHDIRWAIDSTHVYWLDRPERSSGLTDLAHVDGVEAVRTDGDYTLYRVTGCGLEWATPARPPCTAAGRHTPGFFVMSSWTPRNALGPRAMVWVEIPPRPPDRVRSPPTSRGTDPSTAAAWHIAPATRPGVGSSRSRGARGYARAMARR